MLCHGPQPESLPVEVSLWFTEYSNLVMAGSDEPFQVRVTDPSPAAADSPVGAAGGPEASASDGERASAASSRTGKAASRHISREREKVRKVPTQGPLLILAIRK